MIFSFSDFLPPPRLCWPMALTTKFLLPQFSLSVWPTTILEFSYQCNPLPPFSTFITKIAKIQGGGGGEFNPIQNSVKKNVYFSAEYLWTTLGSNKIRLKCLPWEIIIFWVYLCLVFPKAGKRLRNFKW